MNFQKYLQRINLSEISVPSLENLTLLQQQHLLHVPFENLDIHLNKKIILDYDCIFQKVVEQRRGGFCYELNGLFYLLLKELGYEVRRVSARVRGDSGRIGKEFDHMALIVKLGQEEFLTDVGFGKFSFLPLKLELEKVQSDDWDAYKISKYDEQYFASNIREKDGSWRIGYLFSLKKRHSNEFEALCHYQQTSPESNFTKRRMITIPTEKGRVTLTDSKLKINESGQVIETDVNSEVLFQKHLNTYFGMDYEY